LRDKLHDCTKESPVLEVLEVLDVVTNTYLQPGSRILEAELGVISSSIPVQLAVIENALSKTQSRQLWRMNRTMIILLDMQWSIVSKK
jgi:hypothetical protein